ncbi:unnamed protein product [Rotaria sordida]|uniref:Uncharacterized protein n=1 Tax=Rotaria sordida TaxID=392033 RepID=A0A818IZJ7_9BILA|nr:unnamed protein product [Rotaria sordida]CAF3532726.1 unnamed protein product [Rotaria sordida]
MLVQHFFPSTSTATISNSSFSPSSPPSSLMKNKKSSILSPFFNSESTGFQPTIEQNIRLGCSEKIKTHLSAWPSKLTSVMEIHRQRFSQLNPRFKQQQQQYTTATFLHPIQQSVICPVILPSTTRPQPRQEARSKQNQQPHLPPTQTIRRPNTAQIKQQQQQQSQSLSDSNHQYITLTNLTKILHVLQTQVKINDNDTSTDMSSSTTNSAKQRVQQHLQDTATRWWKPVRSSDSHTHVLPPSSIYSYGTSATSQLTSADTVQQHQQEPESFPLITIVSNSTRQLNVSSINGNGTSKYDESESSTEIQTTVIASIVQPPKTATNTKRARQEPLIMQARGMRLHSYDHHYYYKKQNNMNFLQQQRLIRQT